MKFSLALVLVVSSFAGCVGTAPSPSVLTPIAEADFDGAYAAAVCDSVKDCCAQSAIAYDRAACLHATHFDYAESSRALGEVYDPDAAARCVAAVRAVAGTCSPTSDAEIDQFLRRCFNVFHGGRKPGESCSGRHDCAGAGDAAGVCFHERCALSNFNVSIGDACQSALAQSVPLRIGSCWNSPDLFCDYGSDTCQPRRALGAACGTSLFECSPGSVCDRGTCVAQTADYRCKGNDDCAGGSWCDQEHCVPVKKVGESCLYGGGECGANNCDGNKCVAGLLTSAATCGGGH
jgi:hypothetical protein